MTFGISSCHSVHDQIFSIPNKRECDLSSHSPPPWIAERRALRGSRLRGNDDKCQHSLVHRFHMFLMHRNQPLHPWIPAFAGMTVGSAEMTRSTVIVTYLTGHCTRLTPPPLPDSRLRGNDGREFGNDRGACGNDGNCKHCLDSTSGGGLAL